MISWAGGAALAFFFGYHKELSAHKGTGEQRGARGALGEGVFRVRQNKKREKSRFFVVLTTNGCQITC